MRVEREEWTKTWFPFLWERFCVALTQSTGSQFMEWFEYKWSLTAPNP